MKLVSKMFALTALAIACSAACAAEATPLTVTGNITPNACDPVIDNRGVIDFGEIVSSSLSNSANENEMPTQHVNFNVTCPAATKLIFSMKENRPGTSYLDMSFYFGLGVDKSGNKIGTAAIWLSNPTIDGVAGSILASVNKGASWSTPASSQVMAPVAGTVYNITTAGSRAPTDARKFGGTFDVDGWIAPRNQLDTTDIVQIDGSVTMNFAYL